jgi:hypothetical protein
MNPNNLTDSSDPPGAFTEELNKIDGLFRTSWSLPIRID